MFVLIVYDISNDKRRTKLHDTLLDYGTAVQYSVFECIGDKKHLKKMKQAVMRTIKPKKDRVRFYTLCQRCLSLTEVTSGPEVLHETQTVLI